MKILSTLGMSAVVAAALFAGGAHAQNVVNNGTFSGADPVGTADNGDGWYRWDGAVSFTDGVAELTRDVTSTPGAITQVFSGSFALAANTPYMLSFDFSGTAAGVFGITPNYATPTLSGAPLPVTGVSNFDTYYSYGAGTGHVDTIFTTLNVASDYTLWFKTLSPSATESTRIDNVSLSVTAVPEPESYAMMLSGLGALGFMARRRRRVE